MQKVLVSVYAWDNPKLYESDFDLSTGDMVIVAAEYANEIGIVEGLVENAKEETKEKVLRIATQRDREVFLQCEEQKESCLEACRKEIKETKLEMKLIDARVSLDGKQIIFAFTADGRVDFRELVRKLSKELKKSIRMQQIGSRDEARKLGGYGICGRELCCVRNNGNMQSITTDMARAQQIAHRGSDRMSGLCGRLMCCLAYEAQQYKDMLVGMPELHSNVDTSEGRGFVIEINAITQEIKVKLENGKYISVKKEDIK
ncbi:MAG: PSP1 protein [uncultured bacterium]|nr:MAG: PSP1 protein [uncultured bacterium]HCU70129.1 stage 0 sporulation protein [Candidatus Moranbacteria bacterium]